MTAQPEALRLADALEMSSNHGIRREAAAELRRLVNENEALRRERDANLDTINVDNAIITRLLAQRDALLEALQNLDANPELTSAWLQARAAIKAAEENI